MAGVRKRLGILRGPKGTKGDGIRNPRISGDNLVVDSVIEGASTPLNVGSVRGPQGLPGANAVPTAEAIRDNILLPGVARTALEAEFTTRRVGDAGRKQADLFGRFLRKLAYNEPVRIACMGDSTTGGYDIVSADKVTAPRTASNGAVDNFTKSPKPWPSVLQDRLNDAYQSAVTVVNRGFSGDQVTHAWDHWNASAGADLTTLCFGINDNNYNGSVQAFIEGYERLILRELNDYGSAVVILTPIKQLETAGGKPGIDVYRHAVMQLAEKYSIPVIDTKQFFAGYDSRTHSDALHLNTFGNNVMGSRLAAAFIGYGPHSPFSVMHGSKLAARPYLDNLQIGRNAVVQFGGTATPADGGDGTGGVRARIGGSQTLGVVTYSFYTETADLVAIPQYIANPGAAIEILLDYNIEQGDNVNDQLIGLTPSLTDRAVSRIQKTSGGTAITQAGHATGVDVIRIANPGWHTLRFWGGASGSTATALVLGVEFVDHNTLRMMQQLGI
ncbi:GDSL-type esterase/lipase family protein [Agrococcus sp. SL85]|uniref:SGNH/GDSL hydrolase family protein n=1 Tax=Agrococcus sp. SL85 TaxID=2995141 RepID=UPI00226C87AF|nr:GDSL-type esterase/lipase family protein [Agrococcus sp. SL85]WAC65192.1 GDSL-type esterase/lipase family protein [Agrococcus sp. SL85]